MKHNQVNCCSQSSIGIDVVSLPRIARWGRFSLTTLGRFFSPEELSELREFKPYSRGQQLYLASRFAVKEAFYKAYSQHLLEARCALVPFSAIARCIFVRKQSGVPQLSFNWLVYEQLTGLEGPECRASVSFSHEETHAIATVFLSPLCTSCIR